MVSVIFDESAVERRTANAVREEVSLRLRSGDWSAEAIAKKLGLVPDGLEAVLRRRWTFEQAFRIAQAVGVDFGGKLSESERADF